MNLPYITWKPINKGKPKLDKVPWNSVTNGEANPLDSSWWLTPEQLATVMQNDPELKAGFVLHDQSPYFVLDLDDCLEADGTWSPGVIQICQIFNGAAVEVSINGKGLHILGQCNPLILGDRRNKFDLYGVQCEFYHKDRFIALGHGFTGNMDIDWTQQLASLVPVRDQTTTLALVDQADPLWNGPEDDNELISAMLNSQGSAGAVFGNKAHVKDLWFANVDKLTNFYPSASGDSFDRSSADAALMSHLAFWTGKNTDRMDRLFRQSKLMREKYETRSDYRSATVSGAVGKCNAVYQQKRSVPALKESEPDVTIMETNQLEFIGLGDQEEYFHGCVYVADMNRVLMPNGSMLQQEQFNIIKGGFEFQLGLSSQKKTDKAWEAFTRNRYHQFPKAEKTRFKPSLPFQAIVDEIGVNVYKKPEVRSIPGDATPILQLLAATIPDERDQKILLSWLAANVQYPGHKFLWACVVQGVEGNGKSIWGDLLTYSLGRDYCWSLKPHKISKDFNASLHHRLLINVQEMNMSSKYASMDILKDYITQKSQEIELKGVDGKMDYDYCANWYFTTNHKDAVVKTANDRRLAIFFTRQQTKAQLIADGLTESYWVNLWNWLNADGFAIVDNFLRTYPIPEEFDPTKLAVHAPVTSSNLEAISASLGAAEQHILEAIESEQVGFKGGWVSSYKVAELLKEVGVKVNGPRRISTYLNNLGYEYKFRASSMLLNEMNQRPRIYGLPTVSGDLTTYMSAQGYITR